MCDAVLSYFDRNGSYVSTRRIADQCGRNIIAQKAPVIRANENLNVFRIIFSLKAKEIIIFEYENLLDDQILLLYLDFICGIVVQVYNTTRGF